MGICHLISGDLWGGAGVVPFSLLRELGKFAAHDLDVSPGIFGVLGLTNYWSRTRGEGELCLPPDAPSRWKALIDFLEVQENNTSFDVIDRIDLRPFWVEGPNYFLRVVR